MTFVDKREDLIETIILLLGCLVKLFMLIFCDIFQYPNLRTLCDLTVRHP